MKDFSLLIFNNQAKLVQDRRNNIIATKKKHWFFSKDFSWEIKSLLSTKYKNKTGIFRFLICFSNI